VSAYARNIDGTTSGIKSGWVQGALAKKDRFYEIKTLAGIEDKEDWS
jgi:hypothetical protein